MGTFYTDIGSPTGDMDKNIQGDLSTISGIDNLITALQRRFETPYGSLFYDTTYGNKLLDRLSRPMGKDFEHAAISDVTECMMGDRRVQSTTVTIHFDRENRKLLFRIYFVAIDGSTSSFERVVSILV